MPTEEQKPENPEVGGQGCGNDDKEKKEDKGAGEERTDNVAYDAGYGDLVADHLLSLIEGSVDHRTPTDSDDEQDGNVNTIDDSNNDCASMSDNDALGNVWRAPGRDDDDDSSDSDDDEDNDDDDGAYDFGPSQSSLSALDPRRAASHAASAKEQGRQQARQQAAVAAAAKAAAQEQQRRATRRAAEMARRKALLGVHQVKLEPFYGRMHLSYSLYSCVIFVAFCF